MQVIKAPTSSQREHRIANFGDIAPDLNLKRPIKLERQLEYTPEEEKKIANFLSVQTNTKGKRVYKMKHSEIEHSEIVEKRIEKIRCDASWRLVGDSNSKNSDGQTVQKLFQGKHQNFGSNSYYYLAIPKNGVLEIHKIHHWYSFSPLPLHQNLQASDILTEKQHVKAFSDRLSDMASNNSSRPTTSSLEFNSVSSFVQLEQDLTDIDAIHKPTTENNSIFKTGGSYFSGNLGLESQDGDVELFAGTFADDEDETTVETSQYHDSVTDAAPQDEDEDDINQSLFDFDQEKDPFAEDEEFEIEQWEKLREKENLQTFSDLKGDVANSNAAETLDEFESIKVAESRLVDDWKTTIQQQRVQKSQFLSEKQNLQEDRDFKIIRSTLLNLLLSQDGPLSLPELLERFQLVKSQWRKLSSSNHNRKKWDFFRKTLKSVATKTKPGKQILFQIKPLYKSATTSSRSKRKRTGPETSRPTERKR